MVTRSPSVIRVLSVVAALALSGCALTAHLTTDKPYDAADGIGDTGDGVVAQNMMLVTSGVNKKAVLVGSLYNETGTPVNVAVTVEGGTVSFAIPSESTVKLGVADGDEEIITTSTIAPGFMSEVTITVDGGAPSTNPLIVLDGTLPQYEAILTELHSNGS